MIRNSPVLQATLVFFAVVAAYVPRLGSYGLFDPWETHYAEVARTMLQRDDPVSTYWQDDGFYSKPPLLFWMQAAGFRAAGLNGPDGPDNEFTTDERPEWAARLPVVLLAALAAAGVFLFLRRRAGPYPALFASMALAFAPHFALVARQSITDMPFLALMTLGMLAFFEGFLLEDDAEPASFFRRSSPRRPSGFEWASAAAIALPVLVQYAVFAPRVQASFAWNGRPVTLSGWLVFSPYALLLADVLWGILRGHFSPARLWILLGAALCALAVLAKGFGALFIPAAVFLLYFLLTGEWERLRRFPLFPALWVVVAISFPWHHAMIVRHGDAFFQEYIVHHHFKRAAEGVHGERGTFAYYLNQMLFGLLPLWPALAASLPAGLRRLREWKPSGENRLLLLAFLWMAVSFFLFSFMLTKFHHYILPVAVPAAIWTALALFGGNREETPGQGWRPRFSPALFTGFALLALTVRETVLDPAHFINLFIYKYERLFPYEDWMPWAMGAFGGLVLAAAAVLVFWRNRSTWTAFLLAGALYSLHLLVLYMPAVGPHWSQKQLHAIYFQCRRNPGQRLIAWQLNWRGENFYSKNKVVPLMETDNKEFLEYLRRYRAKTREEVSARFIVLEASRYQRLVNVLNQELYTRYPEIYDYRRGEELVTILGPGCREIPPVFVAHPVQTHYKVLSTPYVHNKFLMVRLTL